MQKHVNIVDLVKSFPTNIFLQNLASMQKRTSPIKFDHLAETSEKGSISNLSTEPGTASRAPREDSRPRGGIKVVARLWAGCQLKAPRASWLAGSGRGASALR